MLSGKNTTLSQTHIMWYIIWICDLLYTIIQGKSQFPESKLEFTKVMRKLNVLRKQIVNLPTLGVFILLTPSMYKRIASCHEELGRDRPHIQRAKSSCTIKFQNNLLCLDLNQWSVKASCFFLQPLHLLWLHRVVIKVGMLRISL